MPPKRKKGTTASPNLNHADGSTEAPKAAEVAPTSSSTCKYHDVDIREHISLRCALRRQQGLDSLAFKGRRNQKRARQNFAILSKTTAKELAAGLLSLSCGRLLSLTLNDCLPCCLGIEALQQRMDLLRLLDISNNPIGPSGAALLAQYLQDNTTLQSLVVANCSLVGVRVARMRVEGELDLEGFRSLLFSLAVHPVLAKLDLSGNYLGGTSTGNVCSPYQRMYGYSSSSSSNYIEEYGSDSMKILAYFLQINRTVASLNINTNGFEDSRELSSLILSEVANHPTCNTLLACPDRTSAVTPTGPAATFTSIALAGIHHDTFLSPLPSLTTLSFKNACLASFTGRLLGAEKCLFGHVISLDLSENLHFGDAGLINFCSEIGKHDRAAASTSSCQSTSPVRSSLRHLALRKTGLTRIGMQSLCSLLARVPLISLDVAENAFLDVGASILCAGLTRNKSVTSLDLSAVGLTAAGVTHVSRLLEHSTALICLDLSHNEIGDSGVLSLQAVLSSQTAAGASQNGVPTPGLRSLMLCSADVQSRGAQAFASILTANSRLQYLSLQGNVLCGRRTENTFDPTPVINIGQALHVSNRSLTCLNLSKSDIGARSTRRLMSALIANQHIRTLIIDSCNISEEGAVHIGEALPDLTSLRTLQVSNCGIGPVGGQSFFLGLAENLSITALDVSGNQLSGYVFGENNNTIEFCVHAITALSDGIARNKVLRTLNLSNNRLFGLSQDRHTGTEGDLVPAAITKLAEGIEQNGSNGGQLRVINILENRLSSTGEQSCTECIESFCRLHDVVRGNPQQHGSIQLAPRERPAFTRADCVKCKGTDEVDALLRAVRGHPLLFSVLGIAPATKRVSLASLRCCDHTVQFLSQELLRNQTVTSVDLDNNGISDRGVRILMQSVSNNVALKCLRLPLSEPPGQSTKDREKFDGDAADVDRRLQLEAACLQSFNKRITLALFARAFGCLGAAGVRGVLEFAIGKGCMVETYVKHRVVWSHLPRHVWGDMKAYDEKKKKNEKEEEEEEGLRKVRHVCYDTAGSQASDIGKMKRRVAKGSTYLDQCDDADDAVEGKRVVDKHLRRRLTYIN